MGESTNAFGFIQHDSGEIFLDTNHEPLTAHIVARVDQDPLPTDEDAPSYEAICGTWGFGYGMGTIAMAEFISSAEDAIQRGATLCASCFPSLNLEGSPNENNTPLTSAQSQSEAEAYDPKQDPFSGWCYPPIED